MSFLIAENTYFINYWQRTTGVSPWVSTYQYYFKECYE